jgi:DNA-binding transcriptional ArsR family regulator
MTKSELDILRDRATEVAGLMKTLSHPNRLLIACELMNGERAVSEIEENTGVRQPVLSRELARLRDENLVTTRRASKVVFYSLSSGRLLDLMTALCQSWGGKTPMSAQTPVEEKQATFPIIEGRKGTRVRINPNPYRKD